MKVTVIPEKIPEIKKRRVAVYARVSTGHEDQENSLEAQKQVLSDLVRRNPNMELVKVYSDRGRSGTSTEHRKVFNRMIKDAINGKIDLIVTKTISRFSRNALDAIAITRELKSLGVEVYFEAQDISSFSSDGELMFSIYSSMAQEESRSMSESIKWGIKRKMERGEFTLPYKVFLGYKKGDNNLPEIVEEEAAIVRKIYKFFLRGMSMNSIADVLTMARIMPPGGGKRWYIDTVKSILTNEKYAGNALLQKTYIEDYLTHKELPAKGKVRQYYVENSHPAIIPLETFNQVQEEIKRRKDLGKPLNYY